MAETLAARRVTVAYRRGQTRLAADTIASLRAVWSLLDPDDLDGTLDRWLTAALPIVAGKHASASRLAAAYVDAFKHAETGGSTSPVLADLPPQRAVVTSLLVTGPVSIKQAMRRGVLLGRAVDTAEASSAAAGMRHVLDGGRNTIRQTLAGDRDARGWSRVTSGSACSFCEMLAGRGAVYGADTAGFQSHDGCGCSAEPVYR